MDNTRLETRFWLLGLMAPVGSVVATGRLVVTGGRPGPGGTDRLLVGGVLLTQQQEGPSNDWDLLDCEVIIIPHRRRSTTHRLGDLIDAVMSIAREWTWAEWRDWRRTGRQVG